MSILIFRGFSICMAKGNRGSFKRRCYCMIFLDQITLSKIKKTLHQFSPERSETWAPICWLHVLSVSKRSNSNCGVSLILDTDCFSAHNPFLAYGLALVMVIVVVLPCGQWAETLCTVVESFIGPPPSQTASVANLLPNFPFRNRIVYFVL